MAFRRLGNKVVISGRREEVLMDVAAQNPGIGYVTMDVTDPASVRAAAAEVTGRFPELNVVINNAGVQRSHDLAADTPLDDQALLDEVNTNLLGVLRCSAAFLPHLKTKGGAMLINVSSGLAFVPLARFPVYCATKAAVHSFTVSLRHQLRGTGVKVVELIPPYVATELDRTTRHGKPEGGPASMPLDAFIHAAMEELSTGGEELPVAEAKRLHAAGTNDAAKVVFGRMNG